MPNEIIVALLALVGTALGTFGGIRLVTYRLEQLEKKVDKHNNVIERTLILEQEMKHTKSDVKDIKEIIREIKEAVYKE